MTIRDQRDHNDMAFWFPPLEAARLPVPRTEMVRTEVELLPLLDGETPEGWEDFIHRLALALDVIGMPCFLRTGHLSGKHSWKRTCYLPAPDPDEVPAQGARSILCNHVGALVKESALAGLFGLPTYTWAVRELLPTDPICHCTAYGGMPVVREFRFFVRDRQIEHVQPYWPPDAVEKGHPDTDDWRERLREISQLSVPALYILAGVSRRACRAVGGGFWSIDWLQARDGRWWLTDMARGDDSFRYDPEEA